MANQANSQSSIQFNQLSPIVQAALTQDVLDAMGLKDLSESEKHEIYETMLATIKDRVLARILDELTKEQQNELTRLVDYNTPEAVDAFVTENIPELENIMVQVAIQYKAEMIQNAQHINQILGTNPDTNSDNLPVIIEEESPVPYTPPTPPALFHPD